MSGQYPPDRVPALSRRRMLGLMATGGAMLATSGLLLAACGEEDRT